MCMCVTGRVCVVVYFSVVCAGGSDGGPAKNIWRFGSEKCWKELC